MLTQALTTAASGIFGEVTIVDGLKGLVILSGIYGVHRAGKTDRNEQSAKLDSITQTLTGIDGRSGPDSLMGKMDVVQRKTGAIEIELAKLSERVDGHEKRLDRTEDDRRITQRRAEDRT